MTIDELMKQLSASIPPVYSSAPGDCYSWISELGSEFVSLVAKGEGTSIARAFAIIEQGLLTGDSATCNLLVSGLLNSMQAKAYSRLNPPDLLDQYFGPETLEAWGDLIEGHTGKGIRSIESWKRIICNGRPGHITIFNEKYRIRIKQNKSAEYTGSCFSNQLESILKPDTVQALVNYFHPFQCDRLLDSDNDRTTNELSMSNPVMSIEIAYPRYNLKSGSWFEELTQIRVGRQVNNTTVHYASCGNKVFLLNIAPIVAIFPDLDN